MIVLDNSVAIEIATETKLGNSLRSFIREGEEIISCSLLRIEAASTARKLKRKGNLSNEDAWGIMRDAINLVDDFATIEELEQEAFQESIRLDHSVYDMFYFVLARRSGGALFTLDRSLMKLCEENGVDCIHEIDFPQA